MDIIIVGAGIAGLAAGIGLRRAGHRVTILEQSSLLHEVGAAITVKPNASRVLASWDFEPAASRMVALRGLTLIDGTNMQTLVPTYYKGSEATWGTPMYAVHRVDLHTQLRQLATQPDGVGHPCEVRVRCPVVDYDAAHGRVTTRDGAVLQADLVVAADGVHSKAVQHVLGGSGAEHVVRAGDTGWACMRWLVPRDVLLADPETAHMVQDSATRYFTAAGGAAGLVWYPCRDNEVQNFLYLSRDFDTSRVGEDFRTTVPSSMPLEYAKKHFAPTLQAIISKAQEVQDVKFWRLVARGPIPQWHRDKLVLVGDAAHPMLPFQGQGGGQAIEDGAALGILLDQVTDAGQVADRLRLFEQVRHDRGSALQILSSRNPPAPQSVRDAAAAYLPPGTRLDSTDDTNAYVFSFDVIKECKAALAAM